MKCALALATLFFVSLWSAATTSNAVGTQSGEAAVRAAEKARTTALVHGDVAALEKLMANDVTYVHASGKSDTKASYLDAIRGGQLRYLLWEPHQMNVRVLGETAVLNGMYSVRAIDLRVQKDPLNLEVFFLTVYAHRDGRWQQIAWQTTRAPATSK